MLAILSFPSGPPLHSFPLKRVEKGRRCVWRLDLQGLHLWASLSSEFTLCLSKVRYFEGGKREELGFHHPGCFLQWSSCWLLEVTGLSKGPMQTAATFSSNLSSSSFQPMVITGLMTGPVYCAIAYCFSTPWPYLCKLSLYQILNFPIWVCQLFPGRALTDTS